VVLTKDPPAKEGQLPGMCVLISVIERPRQKFDVCLWLQRAQRSRTRSSGSGCLDQLFELQLISDNLHTYVCDVSDFSQVVSVAEKVKQEVSSSALSRKFLPSRRGLVLGTESRSATPRL
jgi:hypothetical protein